MSVTAESLKLKGATLAAVEVSTHQTTLIFHASEETAAIEVNIESRAVLALDAALGWGEVHEAGLGLGRLRLDLIGKTVDLLAEDEGDLVITFADTSSVRILVEGPYESYQVTVSGETVLVK